MRGLAPAAPVAWCLALGVVAAPAVAQEGTGPAEPPLAVVSARLTAEIASDSDGVDVELEYRFNRALTAADGPLGIQAVGIGNSRVESFELVRGIGEVDRRRYALPVERGLLRATEIDLAAAGDGDALLRYRVTSAVRLDDGQVRVSVPLLVLDLAPAPPSTSTFRTALTVPEGWAVASTFPAGLTGQGPVWSGELQVLPAFVAVRGRTDGRWRPGLPWALDLATVLILAAVSFVGWRHLSGVVREARA